MADAAIEATVALDGEQADRAPVHLSDGEVQARLARLDELIERIEQTPGPGTDMALEAIESLAAVYGTALARVVQITAGGQASVRALAADDLVGHLLLLHGLHPDPLQDRIARALDDVRPLLGGAEVVLTGIANGVATVQLQAPGCQSTASALAASIGDIVLAAAPELAGVEPVAVKPASTPALISVDSLLHRPVTP